MLTDLSNYIEESDKLKNYLEREKIDANENIANTKMDLQGAKFDLSRKTDQIKVVEDRIKDKMKKQSDFNSLIERMEDATKKILVSQEIIYAHLQNEGSKLKSRKNELLKEFTENQSLLKEFV